MDSKEAGDIELGDVSQKLLVHNESTADKSALFINTDAPVIEFTGLTKEELMQYANNPSWKRIRIVLFVLFWLVWIGMLIAAIIMIVFAPKCPKKPLNYEFLQKFGKEIYKVNPGLFLDTDGDGVGDWGGIQEKIDYIQNDLRSGILLLDPILSNRNSFITDYNDTDKLYTVPDPDDRTKQLDFTKLVKKMRKKGLITVIGFDVVCTSDEHEWLKNEKDYYLQYPDTLINVSKAFLDKDNLKLYSAIDPKCPQLNLQNENLLNSLKTSMKNQLRTGVDGIYLTNVAFINPNFTEIQEKKPEISGFFKGQLQQSYSIEFVKKVRSWLDEIADEIGKKSGKDLVLIVNPGNVQVTAEYCSSLYGNYSNGAHLVVDSTLSGVESFADFYEIANLIQAHPNFTALMSQGKLPKRNFVATILSKTLPGTSISMYGEEYGLNSNNAGDVLAQMQWDPTGGFTNATANNTYKDYYYNVKAQSAVGLDDSLLLLFRRLQNLTQEPSFQWGNFSWIGDGITGLEVDTKKNLMFYRHADGYNRYVLVISDRNTNSSGLLQDFKISADCSSATVVIAYPAGTLQPDPEKKIPMDKVFMKYSQDKFSFYVFKCE